MTELLIENVIAVAHIHQQIPLDALVGSFPDITYDPIDQPVCVIRFSDPKRAVFILSDGQFFCTGSPSFDVANETLNNVMDMVKKTGIGIQDTCPVKIHTITASYDVGQSLKLSRVNEALPIELVSYQPNQSPWLEYHPSEHLVILFFPSGKLILTGHTTLEEIKAALNSVKHTLTLKGILENTEGKHA